MAHRFRTATTTPRAAMLPLLGSLFLALGALARPALSSPPDTARLTPPWVETPAGTPAPEPPVTPVSPQESRGLSGPIEPYGYTPDPAITHHFQLPTARPLRAGDLQLVGTGALGYVGVRYGFHPRFDAGIGLPYYLAGLSADARYALVLTQGVALSLWAMATIPVLPGDNNPSLLLGFTWSGSGAAWLAGPLLSLWGARAGVHLGLHVAQRVLLVGAWGVGHVTVDIRILDALKFFAQGLVFAEVVPESASGLRAAALVGNTHPRVFPYALAGVRLHSRRFAVDVGLLTALSPQGPLAGGSVGVWPWFSATHGF